MWASVFVFQENILILRLVSPLSLTRLAGVSSLTQPLPPSSPPAPLVLLAQNTGWGRRGVVTEADALLEAHALLAGLLVDHPRDLAQLLLRGHHSLLGLGSVDWACGGKQGIKKLSNKFLSTLIRQVL